jgi:ABC-type phosphate transport system permease subunit
MENLLNEIETDQSNKLNLFIEWVVIIGSFAVLLIVLAILFVCIFGGTLSFTTEGIAPFNTWFTKK